MIGTATRLAVANTLLALPFVNLTFGGKDFKPLVQFGYNAVEIGNIIRQMPPGMIKTVGQAGFSIAAALTGVDLVKRFL